MAAARLRRSFPGELLLGTSGLLAIAFGTTIAALARMSLDNLILPLSAFTFISGVALLRLGLRLQAIAHRPHAMRFGLR